MPNNARSLSYVVSTNGTLRRVALPLLARLSPGDITITHHFTGDPFRLDAFRHRGYWFNGRHREAGTTDIYLLAIEPTFTVVEVGAHIGYQTLLFSRLAPDGQVFAFEPGQNNLPYLLRNTRSCTNVHVRRQALGDATGSATLWCEDLSGQNNSLRDAFELLEANARSAHVRAVERYPLAVEVTTLDDVSGNLPTIDFVKIDAEGAEVDVLRGGMSTLTRHRPALMVEIERGNGPAVFDLLRPVGYRGFDPARCEVLDPSPAFHNTFFFHPDRHERTLTNLHQTQGRRLQ